MAQGGEVSAAWHGTQAPPTATRYSQGAPPRAFVGPLLHLGHHPFLLEDPCFPCVCGRPALGFRPVQPVGQDPMWVHLPADPQGWDTVAHRVLHRALGSVLLGFRLSQVARRRFPAQCHPHWVPWVCPLWTLRPPQRIPRWHASTSGASATRRWLIPRQPWPSWSFCATSGCGWRCTPRNRYLKS